MKKIDACKLRRKGGFTLVELIVVLVLLAMLSAVAVPTYLGYVDDNKAKQCETHRKALASRLEEMSAMGSTASLTEEVLNSDENGCPAGGNYTLTPSADGEINSMTIECSEHGSTTVLLKNNSQVTAKSNTETEKKVEKEPEQTDPPVKPTPVLSISITPNPVAMEKEQTQNLTANVVSKEHCEISSYEWRSDNSNIVSVSGSGQTATITAVNEGTCTIFCKAIATASAEAGGQSFGSMEASVQVTVNPVPSLSISLAGGLASTYSLGVESTQWLNVIPTEVRCKNTSYSWSLTGGNAVHIEGGNKNAAVTIKADQAGECILTCQATAISEVDNSTVISSSNEVVVNIKVASLSISVDPSSVSDEVEIGSPISLTALPTQKNCTVSRYNWWLENGGKGVLNITEGWNAQTVSINAQTNGSCKVYCQAFAKPDGSEQEISSNTVEIPVQVKEEETEPPVFAGEYDILVSGATSGGGDTIYTNLSNAKPEGWMNSLPSGGVWKADTEGASCPYNNDYAKIVDDSKALCYDFIYTVNGKQYKIKAQVVYPVLGDNLHEHRGFWTKGSATGSDDGNDLKLDTSQQLWLSYYPAYTTDRDTIRWYNQSEDIITFEDIWSVSGNSIITVKAINPGTANVKVTIQNQYYNKEYSKTLSFTVPYRDITGITCDSLEMTVNDSVNISDIVNISPSEDYDPNGLSYNYWGFSDAVSIANGIITAKKTGTTTGTIQLLRNGNGIASNECTITVVDNSQQSESAPPTNSNRPTSSAEFQGHKFGSASWDELKNYLMNASGTTAESTVVNSVFVAQYQNNPDHYYVLRPGVDINGLNISNDMTFEKFVEQRGDLFCEINQYNGPVTWHSNNNNVNKGQIIEKDGIYYVYIRDHLDMDPNTEWKPEDYVQLFLMD